MVVSVKARNARFRMSSLQHSSKNVLPNPLCQDDATLSTPLEAEMSLTSYLDELAFDRRNAIKGEGEDNGSDRLRF